MLQEITKENTDKKVLYETLNGLSIFAVQQAAEGAEDSAISLIRKIIKEMSAYWEMDTPKNWFQEFDQRVQQARQGKKPHDISMADKIATLYGLAGYSEELMRTHGLEEQNRQKEIQQVMDMMEQTWEI